MPAAKGSVEGRNFSLIEAIALNGRICSLFFRKKSREISFFSECFQNCLLLLQYQIKLKITTMKNVFKKMFATMALALAFSGAAYADKDTPITLKQLPTRAQILLRSNFKGK